jgi:hypothetical protein
MDYKAWKEASVDSKAIFSADINEGDLNNNNDNNNNNNNEAAPQNPMPLLQPEVDFSEELPRPLHTNNVQRLSSYQDDKLFSNELFN